ncbi:hypothetical protein [Marinicauda sp. Alg238-R41]|uniref:hypothetical protein n=1 Tax=Marinicauda sp. Alg238-R41 TaxID=2993447 RepID=UPI0022E7C755|nr:hypothetical protein [Marinicauda sp. Alg238-R41]
MTSSISANQSLTKPETVPCQHARPRANSPFARIRRAKSVRGGRLACFWPDVSWGRGCGVKKFQTAIGLLGAVCLLFACSTPDEHWAPDGFSSFSEQQAERSTEALMQEYRAVGHSLDQTLRAAYLALEIGDRLVAEGNPTEGECWLRLAATTGTSRFDRQRVGSTYITTPRPLSGLPEAQYRLYQMWKDTPLQHYGIALLRRAAQVNYRPAIRALQSAEEEGVPPITIPETDLLAHCRTIGN